MNEDSDILTRLADLYCQATTENSHYYTANCVQAAIVEIMNLRKEVADLTVGKKSAKRKTKDVG